MLWTQPRQGQFDFWPPTGSRRLAGAPQTSASRALYAAANPGWSTSRSSCFRGRVAASWRRCATTSRRRSRTSGPPSRASWTRGRRQRAVPRQRGARQNVYQRVIGDDWIEQAFRAANARGPRCAAVPQRVRRRHGGPAPTGGTRARQGLPRARRPDRRRRPREHLGAGGSYPTLAALESVMAKYAADRPARRPHRARRPAAGDLGRRPSPAARRLRHRRAGMPRDAQLHRRDDLGRRRRSTRGAARRRRPTLFSGAFTKKRAYDLVRCRLNDPKPLTGPWTPKDCGPVEVTPPNATTQPPGPADGSSAGSDPPGPS